jgi:hypothetical protein
MHGETVKSMPIVFWGEKDVNLFCWNSFRKTSCNWTNTNKKNHFQLKEHKQKPVIISVCNSAIHNANLVCLTHMFFCRLLQWALLVLMLCWVEVWRCHVTSNLRPVRIVYIWCYGSETMLANLCTGRAAPSASYVVILWRRTCPKIIFSLFERCVIAVWC